jgi:prepilin-type N-terminal cleavage/methylation domain-containing protein
MMRDQRGFTLAEIVVTLVIVGVIMGGLGTLFIGIQRVQAQATYTEIANRAAQRQVEALRNSNYNNLTAGQTINFTSDLPDNLPVGATGTTVVSEPIAGLKKVDVTVSYTYGGTSRNITLSSMIGVLGITQ